MRNNRANNNMARKLLHDNADKTTDHRMGETKTTHIESKNATDKNSPPPFDQIRCDHAGIALGKHLNMHGRQIHGIKHRLSKEKTRGAPRGETLPEHQHTRKTSYKALARADKIHFNIRTTNPRTNYNARAKINEFAQKRMREIASGTWGISKTTQEQEETNTTPQIQHAKQPTSRKWVYR